MNAHFSSEFWSALEAIGTVIAATLALFFWLWAEHLKPWLRSPRLSIEFENAHPWFKFGDCPRDFCSPAPLGQWVCRGDVVRVRILNRGRTTAHNVLIRAMSISDEHGSPVGGVDPVNLCWSDGGVSGYLLLLSPSDYRYADLVGFEWTPDFTFHIISGTDSRGCKRDGFHPGKYYVTLAAYADDAAAHTAILKITLGETEIQEQHGREETLHYFEMKFVKTIPTRR